MRKVTLDGTEYFINNHGVVFRYGEEDIIPGYKSVNFPDMETSNKVKAMVG